MLKALRATMGKRMAHRAQRQSIPRASRVPITVSLGGTPGRSQGVRDGPERGPGILEQNV